MSRYVDLVSKLRDAGLMTRITPATKAELDRLRKEFPALPDDYIEFLTDVGTGSFGDSMYALYSGPVPPDDIYDEQTASKMGSLLLFGDDFAGYNVGYDTAHGWTVVGIDSSNMQVDEIAPSFEQFIQLMAVELLASLGPGSSQS
jgi:hypothetical protein